MAKRIIKEKDIAELLFSAGFREITETDRTSSWYKKAAKQPSCLKAAAKDKVRK